MKFSFIGNTPKSVLFYPTEIVGVTHNQGGNYNWTWIRISQRIQTDITLSLCLMHWRCWKKTWPLIFNKTIFGIGFHSILNDTSASILRILYVTDVKYLELIQRPLKCYQGEPSEHWPSFLAGAMTLGWPDYLILAGVLDVDPNQFFSPDHSTRPRNCYKVRANGGGGGRPYRWGWSNIGQVGCYGSHKSLSPSPL